MWPDQESDEKPKSPSKIFNWWLVQFSWVKSIMNFEICSLNPGQIKTTNSATHEAPNFNSLFSFLTSGWFYSLLRVRFECLGPNRYELIFKINEVNLWHFLRRTLCIFDLIEDESKIWVNFKNKQPNKPFL